MNRFDKTANVDEIIKFKPIRYNNCVISIVTIPTKIPTIGKAH